MSEPVKVSDERLVELIRMETEDYDWAVAHPTLMSVDFPRDYKAAMLELQSRRAAEQAAILAAEASAVEVLGKVEVMLKDRECEILMRGYQGGIGVACDNATGVHYGDNLLEALAALVSQGGTNEH